MATDILTRDVIPGQWIVLLKPYASAAGKTNHLQSVRAMTEDRSTPFSCETQTEFDMPECRGYSAKFGIQTKAEIEKMDGVLSVEPVRRLRHCKWVTQKNASWGLERVSQPHKVKANGPYAYSYDDEAAGKDTVAYIVDSGINPDHVEFEGRATRGKTIVTPDVPTGDEDLVGHGTHVAGTVAGKTYGVAKKARIVSVKVFQDTENRLDSYARNDDTLKALEWVKSVASGTKAVLNMSFGGSPSPALNAAVAALVRSGIVCCSAAGNEQEPADHSSPAQEPLGITVASMDKNDRMSEFSNYGRLVDVFGPGTDILSAWSEERSKNDATKTISGTSMATPHVVGLVCCLLSDTNLEDKDPYSISSIITIRADKNKLQGLDYITTNSIMQVQKAQIGNEGGEL